MQLNHSHDMEVMSQVFAFLATYADDSFEIIAQAMRFKREQVALYGTREIFVRSKINDAAVSKLAQAEASSIISCAFWTEVLLIGRLS